MAVKKELKIHNKSDRPDNIILKENDIMEKCQAVQDELPRFLNGFFAYLKGNVLPMTRLAYLQDVRFFCNYLIHETDLTQAKITPNIKLDDFEKIKAVDVNLFIDYCRRYKVEKEKAIYIYENDKKSLSRKKSSVSVLFKYLYRDELISKNITDAFDPIKIPKPGEREIKALQDDEVMRMLDAVSSGGNLTKKEREFWGETQRRETKRF